MPEEDDIKNPSAAALWDQALKQGRLEERVEQVRQAQRDHVQITDKRFTRLEDAMREGFIQSQRDREAGNKTLGDMIEATKNELKSVVASINQSQGALSTRDKVLSILGILLVTAVGTYLGKVF